MDVVPKQLWTVSVLFAIITASLIMILSGSLDGAAAWANIIALPVAIVGVIFTLRGPSGTPQSLPGRDRDGSRNAAQAGGATPIVHQIGFGETQYNIAGNLIAQDRDRRDGR